MLANRSDNHIYKNIDSVSDFIDNVLHISCTQGSSDIHIDPSYTDVSIRFRVDGSLLTNGIYDKVVHEEVVGRIKILAKLRTDIHDKSQDGRFFF
jgi:type IV pilus assembly protein PilB